MKIQNILAVLSFTASALAATNEPCIGSGGAAGVCITTSACSAAGGTSITGACPSDPSNVRCCTKPSCSNGSNGNCRWQSDCAGSTVANQCPGPAQMKCCSSKATGFGGYSRPGLPAASNACKAVSVNGAKKILDAWPGRVPTMSGREIAEWVMKNRSSLNVKYIIWGQRIWNPSRDAQASWTSWRAMEDRGSITQNHWQVERTTSMSASTRLNS
ncbi:hypothetical protein SAPIO_CDS10065 [Scedosporium apiospermum]|uniref:ARB-07466-like C-terminal domain-containing protein n=1 Tax=Pseudallescheria apiosperma TaxID=563466 RepID=A0A084FWA4_PSEDA|nr:uncharacterized protein SAPIO_CDS10065 [Scedosporium apiospermum]KEZ39366.1 hypothetical protein SAPIO_CDS10065 [Scedosporium apiospermum]